MKYTKFKITNFKGINDLEIDLTKLPSANVFTLVGLNESGKTSILEAIDLFRSSKTKGSAHEMIHKSKKGMFDGDISVVATLKLAETDEVMIREYCEEEINFILSEPVENIEVSKKYSFEDSKCKRANYGSWTINLKGRKKRGKKEVELHDIDKKLWLQVVNFIEEELFPKIIYYENFLFDFPEKIYLESYEGEGREQNEYRDVLQDILSSINEKYTLKAHLLDRLNSQEKQDKESLESTLGDISQKLTTVIFENWDELLGKSNKEIEIKPDEDEHGKYIELKIKQGKDKFFIKERSLGFRWFFSFLLFTEFRKKERMIPGKHYFF